MPGTLTFAVVGHCTPDAFALRTSLGSLFPGSQVMLINDDAALNDALSSTDVCLVNRELDGQFDSADGVELIRSVLSRDGGHTAIILVSNLEDAQQRAVEAGAHMGFGKRDLYNNTMHQSIADAIDSSKGRESA